MIYNLNFLLENNDIKNINISRLLSEQKFIYKNHINDIIRMKKVVYMAILEGYDDLKKNR